MFRSSRPESDAPTRRFQGELDRLITAAAQAPVGEREVIIESVADFEERDQVAELLHEALFELPVHDAERHGLVLSLIGELRHQSSVAELDRFVWLGDEQLLPSASQVEPVGALRARAAEMLVWVSRGAYLERVRRIMYEHPNTQVRMAAIDACAYATGDDPRMLGALREIARVENHWTVGSPRLVRTRETDFEVADFDVVVMRQLREFGGPRPS